MAASSREHVLSLYRLLLKESKKFPSYNYRNKMQTYAYTLRRVRDAFKENRTVEDPKVVKELLNRAQDSLALIQRQVLVQKIDVVTCGFYWKLLTSETHLHRMARVNGVWCAEHVPRNPIYQRPVNYHAV
uniref:LYR motif containing 4 n=2 Tax=Cyprinus carpio TaxID=7962 RepID=A0A9R1SQH6_CYPCA